jgi:hypothetical protein
MAGLQNYVLGNKLSQQPARTDRLAYATNAKVSARKSVANSASTTQPFQNTAPATGYVSNPTSYQAVIAPAWFATKQLATTAQKGLFDDTLSGLDVTESDVGFDERQEVPHNGSGRNQQSRTDNDYVEDEAFLKEDIERFSERPTTPRGGGISGRFHQPPQSQQQHENMELRLSQNGFSIEKLKDSKKSSSLDESSPAFPMQEGRGQNGPDKYGTVGAGNFDASSSGEDSTSDIQNGRLDIGESRTRQNLDYTDHELEGMNYKDLKDETWEPEKHARASNLPEKLQDRTIPLSDRFQSCVNLDLDKVETQEIQVEFFANMSSAEWEEAGDLFIGRFADIMTKLKDARQVKRKIATHFEKLIEEREAVIRGKSENLDMDFEEMRKGGEGVIRGKII